MALEPQFTQAQIKERFDNFVKVIEKRAIQRMQYLGEECVKIAKLNGDYIDRTGNLRSSIGYAIFKNGVAIRVSFEQTASGLGGTNQGRAVALREGAKRKEGLAMVIVVGMNYALAVESRGRDVITSAELFAKQEAPKMMEELKRNINQALI